MHKSNICDPFLLDSIDENVHLNKITNPIILPVLITIIPFIWYFLSSKYGDLEIISICVGIADVILLAIQVFIWYTVFQKRNGTPKIFRNVVNAKDFFIKSDTDRPLAFAYSVIALSSPSDILVDKVGIYNCLQLFTLKVW